MGKYIDAERLKRIIDKRWKENIDASEKFKKLEKVSAIYAASAKEAYDILAIIDSLQQEQPEVDIKKKLHAYICSDEYMNTREDGSLLIARHFYELGKNARKEK